MKIIQALPRRMRFEARKASSVELCVSEWVSGSRYRRQTTIFAEQSDSPPLLDVDIYRLNPAHRFSSWHLAHAIRNKVASGGYKLIVTQQHISTAARIAWFNRSIPVILQTHNFIEPPERGKFAFLRNRLRQAELQSLAGITLVSESTLKQFELDWPQISVPRSVISNGFDFSAWNAEREKAKIILVVGRTDESKGLVEAAEGIVDFLRDYNDWRVIFILSEPDKNMRYFEQVKATLAPAGLQAEILTGIPFARVKELTETAAISVVASKWIEPFGRTALEAHAGGAALISSGTGGLREISGDAALFLPEIKGTAIAAALRRLGADEALRKSLAERGAAFVRSRFSLNPMVGKDGAPIPSMCDRLDGFYDRIVEAQAQRGRLPVGKSEREMNVEL